MSRSTCERLIVLISLVGCIVLVTAPAWGPVVDAWGQPQIVEAPFAQAMRCPAWRQGLSRTVVVMATEDEAGQVVAMQCVRTMERGKVRVM